MDARKEQGTPKAVSEWLVQHAVWMATMLWFALVVVKALSVARMNPATALALLASPELVRIAFSVLLVAVPTLLTALALVVYHWGFLTEKDRDVSERVAAAFVYLIALVLVAGTGPAIQTVVMFLLPVSLLAAHVSVWWRHKRKAQRIENSATPAARAAVKALRVAPEETPQIAVSTDRAQGMDMHERSEAEDGLIAGHERPRGQAKGRSSNATLFIVVTVGLEALAVSLLLLSPEPWLPSERLDTPSGHTVGYVMGEGEWLSVLAEDSHQISRVRAADLSGRSICQLSSPDFFSRTVIDIASSNKPPEYPPCYPKN